MRIEARIWRLMNRKWRAEIYVDGVKILQALFTTRIAAEQWISKQKTLLRQEVSHDVV